MDALAAGRTQVLGAPRARRRAGRMRAEAQPEADAEDWFAKAEKDGNIAPQPKLANEKPKGETVDYDTLIKSWPATPPKR